MAKSNQPRKLPTATASHDAELAAKLTRLADLEARFADALEQAKLDAMKELAYGASHEINNPLANISTRAQTLLKGETDTERRRMLAAIHQQAMRAHEMIADLMLFARPPQPVRSKFDLGILIENVISEFAERATAQQTRLTTINPTEPIIIDADETQIAVAIGTLISNALEAISSPGLIELRLSATPTAAQFCVVDNGPGIAPAALAHIFEPFFSGREAGRGLGFGLSKCWRIITLHGGTITAHSTAKGSSFEISLPLLASALAM